MDADGLENLAHDMRTPLNVVMGFAQVLRSDEADPARQQRLDAILDGARELDRLIESLSDVDIPAGPIG